MTDVVIAHALRTAVGKFGGTLAKTPAPELGATVMRALLERSGIAGEQVSEVILGQVLTAGSGQNPARQALIRSGLPNAIPAMTINKVCGSGLKAVMLAAQAIRCGDADIVIAGGQENMSAAPHVLPGSRDGFRMGDAKLVDSMIVDGLWDVYNQYHMGITAENVAKEYKVSRAEQDAFAVASQNKAEAAQKAGRFKDEIVPVMIPQRKGDPVAFDQDEFIKLGTTPDSVAGAAAGVRQGRHGHGGQRLGHQRRRGGGARHVRRARRQARPRRPSPASRPTPRPGVDPAVMGMGPVPASRRCLEKAGWKAGDLDLLEINEAFAAQACAVNKEMGWDTSRINVNGGAIAIGHPIGASGCARARHPAARDAAQERQERPRIAVHRRGHGRRTRCRALERIHHANAKRPARAAPPKRGERPWRKRNALR